MSQEGQIVHIEFSADDPDAAGKFYSGLFGWKTEAYGGADYTTFEPNDPPGGGFAKVDGQMYRPGTLLAYIFTHDIEGTLKRIVAAGGKIALERMEIPGMGWFALFTDPTGNTVGLFTDQPAK
jgi:predicted enzyme related to lactoylglutathione lyase